MDTKELYELLSAPFPREALSQDKSRNKGGKGVTLTSIRAQWIKERLNTVLGITGWRMSGTYDRNGDDVLYFGKLSISIIYFTITDGSSPQPPLITHEIETVGYARIFGNLGDAYKGAATDALSKAASFLGVGNEVFKGEIDPRTLEPANKPTNQPQPKPGSAGDYVITVGKKYKGQKLRDVPKDDIEGFINWCYTNSKDGKITGAALELEIYFKEFYGEL